MKSRLRFRAIVLFLISSIVIANSSGQVGQIIWEEEFNNFNPDVWNKIIGDGCDEGLCGWGNQELEYYLEDNVRIEEISGEPGNYALILEAKNETVNSSSFTSGKISSENKLAVKYGVIELRIMAPEVETGLWPAAWLLGTNHSAVGWPRCGEADIMEMGQKGEERSRQGAAGVSANNYVGANLIWYDDDACAPDNQTCAASIAYDFHYNKPYVSESAIPGRFLVYRMYWDQSSIRFTVEDEGVERDLYEDAFPIGSGEDAFQKPFYLLLNLAVGGNFTDASQASGVTAPLPGKMIIDYVRVRKWNGQGEIYGPGELMANAGVNITVPEGENVSLNAAGSYGPIVSYTWTLDGAELSNEMAPTLSLSSGSHEIMLTISDAEGNTSFDFITVFVGESTIGEIIWEENFDTFDPSIWNIDLGDGCDQDLCGWGNWELQSYQAENVYIEEVDGEDGNKALVLEARQKSVGNSEFTSGKVTTKDKLAIKYGMIEVRMKVPDLDNGLWPAAWLLGTSIDDLGWPKCGEMDMMEMGHSAAVKTKEGVSGISSNRFVGANALWYTNAACEPDNQTCAASIAYDAHYTTPYTPSLPMNDRFMVYRLYWDDSHLRFTAVDNGIEHDLYTNPFPIGANESAFQQPFYFLLNLAVGGTFTGLTTAGSISAPMPAKMVVDYVRVRKYKGKGEVSYKGGEIMANAGEDIRVPDSNKDGSEEITLDGTLSYGDIVSYEWYEGDAQIARGDSVTVSLLTGIHHITLRTTDSEGNISEDHTVVDVQEIIWEDNFDSYNAESWNKDVGDGCDQDKCGWGNFELQSYQEANVYVEEISGEPGNSALVLEARREAAGNSQFTSGKVTTDDKVNFRYGLYEVRMMAPLVETGLWPAIWMLGDNIDEDGWPHCGEIDMMEMGHRAAERDRLVEDGTSSNDFVGANLIWYEEDACSGENPTCAASIAYDGYYNNPYVSGSGIAERFMIYRLYWDNSKMRFTVEDDGQEHDLYTGPFPTSNAESAYHKPFYFLMNLAVGGNFTDAATPAEVSAPLPAKMYIDYVRVMKWNNKGDVSYGDGLVPSAGSNILVVDKDGDGVETVTLDGSGSYDQDGSIVSWSWKIDETEVATTKTPSIELARGNYTVTLTITDNEGNTSSDVVIVTISSGGLAPLAVAGNDTTVYDEDGDDLVSFTLDASGSTPTNTPITSWSWIENGTEIATGINPVIVFSTGVHELTLVVSDEEGLEGMDMIIVTVIDPDNLPPEADAGEDASYDDDDGDDMVTVTLDGSASSDSDGSIDLYQWYINGSEIAAGATAPVDLTTGVHIITLLITDNDGVTDSDELVLTIVDPDNLAPETNAGEDMKVLDTDRNETESYTLDGSGSADSDGNIVSYLWEEGGVEIGTGVSITLDLGIGEHTFTLTATDDDGVSSSDDVVIKVHQEPIANAGEDQFVVDEDDSGTENVTLDASLSSDPYGSIESYSWTYQEDMEIGTSVSLAFDFSVGTHIVTLEVFDDDGVSATDDVKIIVASKDNQLPVADAGEDIEQVDVNGDDREMVSLDGSGSTDPDGSIYSYVWLEDDAEIAAGALADVEFSKGMHEVVLKVTDNEGATDTDTLIVNIEDACVFEACTKEFKAIVSSNDASATYITFVPLETGAGEPTCLLYYGISGTFPGHSVSPYETHKINGFDNGQIVKFYYTYSSPSGGEKNTLDCMGSFVVGDCTAHINEVPTADAGDDIEVEDSDEDGSEMVTLDGSGSSDPEGAIASYTWKIGSTTVGNGVSPSVVLDQGSHTITLTVEDEDGATDSDEVEVVVKLPDNIEERPVELKVYPSPVSEILMIELNRDNVQHLKLYNAQGVMLVDLKGVKQLDMSAFSKGLYVLEVAVEEGTLVRKVIKF